VIRVIKRSPISSAWSLFGGRNRSAIEIRMNLTNEIDRGLTACIYCGDSTKPRSSEHIVPYSLDGKGELLSASCPDCADMTSKNELVVARKIYGNFRLSQKSASRKTKGKNAKHTHSREVEIGVINANGTAGRALVPAGEYPVQFCLPTFASAGILRGEAPIESTTSIGTWNALLPDSEILAFKN